jgi:hypothetical protein
VLQFELVEVYLEEFQTFEILIMSVLKFLMPSIKYIHLEKSNMLGFKDEDSLKVLTLNQAKAEKK